MQDFSFHLPVEIVFGPGRLSELPARLDARAEKSEHVLIVTDRNLVEATDCLSRVRNALGDRAVQIFDAVEENPSFATAEQGAAQAREQKIDLVVGLGGGSPMDAAKGIAVLATNPGGMKEYMQGKPLERDPLPVVCIPTTSGTGSETTPFAVFTDPEDQSKGGYAHPGIYPRISIVDPELTYSMPETVVINTGLDALTHGIEAYLSTETFHLNDLFATESMRLVVDHLYAAAKKERAAMNAMAYASMLAGAAIAHASTILLHIMAYPLTVFHGVPHGRANAALLPAFLRFMAGSPKVAGKVDRLRSLFKPHRNVFGFVEGLGVPTRLSEYGVQAGELEKYVQKVMVKGDVKITPAEVTEATVLDIYRSTF